MTDRRQAKKGAWKRKPPTEEGYYWYRDENREVVLYLVEPHAAGQWEAWDWQSGRLGLSEYPGEWFGPLKAPE